MGVRVEQDSLGKMNVPEGAYYGSQTVRARENFPITGYRVHQGLIEALALVKKAALAVNVRLGMLDKEIGAALIQAAEEVAQGKFYDQFIVDPIQGGAGTSINMNMNEVLANRALEIMGKAKGDYKIIHPNNHVNMGQSTNDAVPTAIRIGALSLLQKTIKQYEELKEALRDKAAEFDDVLKMGRTHLQDAIPIRLGQEFAAYAQAIGRDIERFKEASKGLLTINLGATAVGTGLNADKDYVYNVATELCEVTGLELQQATDLVDATQNADILVNLSCALRTAAVSLCKIANDLRLLASGPRVGFFEINLPPVQPGSSIMPGKVNPVIAEVMNQISFQVQGNDLTVGLAAQAGQLELNVMLPVLTFNLYQSMEIIGQGAEILAERCIRGITANKERCLELVEGSLGIITAICPHVGYEEATRIAKKCLESNLPVREVLLAEGILTETELDIILDPKEMTEPGIAGKELLGGFISAEG